MQEHREIAADFAISKAQQFLSGTAHHHPISFLDGHAQQGVSNRSANQIHLHA
jgi:hypothetical protein